MNYKYVIEAPCSLSERSVDPVSRGCRVLQLSGERYFRYGDGGGGDLKEKMQLLLEKEFTVNERKKIRKQIEEKYNWDKIAAQTINVYRKALERGA